MSKNVKVEELKVGDKVNVSVLKYKFQGIIVEINNDEVKVEVPTYYGKTNIIQTYKVENNIVTL